ncbi:MAG: hypothetical protein WCD66_01785 [Rhodanobacteraceae bacterium]
MLKVSRSARWPLIALLGAVLVPAAWGTPPARFPPRFPPAAIWNQDISSASPDTNSSSMINASIGWGTGGAGNTAFQIDFSMHVLYSSWGNTTSQPLVPRSGYYLPDCDTGLEVPLPATGAIEESGDYSCSGGDCHLLVVNGDTLYESWLSNVNSQGIQSQCMVIWHLNRLYPANGRGEQCTSADAAGFAIAPLLFNPDEVYAAMQVSNGDLGHAIRFILPNARMRADRYVHPASHAGAPYGPANAIPYGARLRLKASTNISAYNAAAQVILRTLKRYGMFLSDGGNIPLTADDGLFTTHQWSDSNIDLDSHSLFGISLNDFEVMPIGTPVVQTNDCVRNPDDTIYSDGFNW